MSEYVYFVSYTCGLEIHSHVQTYIVRNGPIDSYDDILEVTKEIEDKVGHIMGIPVAITNYIPLTYGRRLVKFVKETIKEE